MLGRPIILASLVSTNKLEAVTANIDEAKLCKLDSNKACISKLISDYISADDAKIESIKADTVNATFASFGQMSLNNGSFSIVGDAQFVSMMLRNTSTNSTNVSLYIDGISILPTIPNNSAFNFTIDLVGKSTTADVNSVKYSGLALNNLGTTTISGPTILSSFNTGFGSGWNSSITASGSSIMINVNSGTTNISVKWVATLSGTFVISQ